MPNELLFVIFFILLSITNLIALKFWKAYLFGLVALYTILMNIFAVKQFDLFWFAVTWWNALYWATFLLTDILSEHYSKKDAYKSVKIWFISMLIFMVCMQFLIWFTPNNFDTAHTSIIAIFSLTPRIFLGSIISYYIAQNLDVFIYHKIKHITKDRFLFLRNNWAAFIAQAVDTLIFTFVWLTTIWWIPWVIKLSEFWEICIATYVIKLIVALLDTPFIYLSYFVKRKDFK